jgi:hypothetical protein
MRQRRVKLDGPTELTIENGACHIRIYHPQVADFYVEWVDRNTGCHETFLCQCAVEWDRVKGTGGVSPPHVE